MRDRTRAALRHNPDNRLLALIWMQGEFDLTTAEYAHQPALFQAMVARFRADMADMAPQMAGGGRIDCPGSAAIPARTGKRPTHGSMRRSTAPTGTVRCRRCISSP
ncbi:sialate O-acetylesterase [Edwardsiella tarda]